MKYKYEIIERIEAITKHTISSSILWKPNGKNITVLYYDITTEKRMRCTVSHGFLPSNIREAK